MEKLSFDQFLIRFCEKQATTPAKLLDVLREQKTKYDPTGWFMLEAQLMDSSWYGSLTVMPYGPNNVHKTIPDHPVSPRGLASDTSVAVAYVLAEEMPDRPPAWTPPPTLPPSQPGARSGRNKKVR